MDTAIPELDITSRSLASLERSQKLKMLVVDDEPDNLDLLYRTFRRDFHVLRAESGIAALEMLEAEGEVAVIISDQRMPEMKGTEFLSKTVPQFPNTMRIILTGFTDVEDLVEAINSGQVYKYITKPWDPGELRAVVRRAAETYELFKQRSEELRRAQAQTLLLSTIADITRQAVDADIPLQAFANIFGEIFSADFCILQLVKDNALIAEQGVYSPLEDWQNWLNKDPLIQEAIAAHSLQLAVNTGSKVPPFELPHYATTRVQTHLAMPIVFRGRVLAVLSLQWKHPITLQAHELTLLQLSTQQVAIALACHAF